MGEPSPDLTVAAVQHAFGIGGGAGPHVQATADAMIVVIGALYDYTDRLFAVDFSRRASAGIDMGVRPPDALTARIEAWSQRLDWYAMAVHSAVPADDPGAILWTVTAPLLTGHYMGPDGDGPLVPPGPWERDPVMGGLVPDMRTPFALAAELNVTADVDHQATMAMSVESFAADVMTSARRFASELPANASRAAMVVGEVLSAALGGLASGIGWGTIALFVAGVLLWKFA